MYGTRVTTLKFHFCVQWFSLICIQDCFELFNKCIKLLNLEVIYLKMDAMMLIVYEWESFIW